MLECLRRRYGRSSPGHPSPSGSQGSRLGVLRPRRQLQCSWSARAGPLSFPSLLATEGLLSAEHRAVPGNRDAPSRRVPRSDSALVYCPRVRALPGLLSTRQARHPHPLPRELRPVPLGNRQARSLCRVWCPVGTLGSASPSTAVCPIRLSLGRRGDARRLRPREAAAGVQPLTLPCAPQGWTG